MLCDIKTPIKLIKSDFKWFWFKKARRMNEIGTNRNELRFDKKTYSSKIKDTHMKQVINIQKLKDSKRNRAN